MHDRPRDSGGRSAPDPAVPGEVGQCLPGEPARKRRHGRRIPGSPVAVPPRPVSPGGPGPSSSPLSWALISRPRHRPEAASRWTSRPRRRMPTRSQTFSTSARTCEENSTVCRCCLASASCSQQLVAHGRVERVGRLIQNEQRRARQPARGAARPCVSCRRRGWRWAGNVDVERGRELFEAAVTRVAVARARSPSRKTHQLPARHVLVEPQFTGQIGDLPAGLHAVVPALMPASGPVPRSAAESPASAAGPWICRNRWDRAGRKSLRGRVRGPGGQGPGIGRIPWSVVRS